MTPEGEKSITPEISVQEYLAHGELSRLFAFASSEEESETFAEMQPESIKLGDNQDKDLILAYDNYCLTEDGLQIHEVLALVPHTSHRTSGIAVYLRREDNLDNENIAPLLAYRVPIPVITNPITKKRDDALQEVLAGIANELDESHGWERGGYACTFSQAAQTLEAQWVELKAEEKQFNDEDILFSSD